MISQYQQIGRISFLWIFILLLTSGLKAQNKKALIVAVESYAPETGWSKINSLNDISLIKNVLLEQGFLNENITVLTDSQATKDQIISTFNEHLIGGLSSGDIAYFHFSGHGQQVQDIDHDEIDGYDESIVPYNANSKFKPQIYEGANHIIDDELNHLYTKLRMTLGPTGHFLVTIDACHSGTSTRSLSAARGTSQIMASPDYIKKEDPKVTDDNQIGTEDFEESSLSSMVAFFGAMAHQLNYEVTGEDGKSYGALSYAFCKAMGALGTDASYRGLFDRMRLIMSARAGSQIPEAEGVLDQPIMGGKFLGSPNYYTIKKREGEKKLTLNGGFLQSLRIGTVVGLFPPETRDYQNKIPLGIGTVTSSDANSSTVLMKENLSQLTGMESWVFVLEESFGDLIIKLDVKAKLSPTTINVSDQLLALPYIEKADQGADLILIEEGNKLLLITPDEIQVEAFRASLSGEALFQRLKSTIIRFGQSEYLRKLSQENKRISLEFDFIPITIDEKNLEKERTSIISKTDSNGTVRFQEGDVFKIVVSNEGSWPAYYTLLDIQPDNIIRVLYPKVNESPADYKLMPGKSFEVPSPIVIGPPYGQELFKLIASSKPIDLRPIEQTRGQTKEVSKDPFEILFSQSFYNEELQSRGGRISGLPAGLVNIYSKLFIIE